MGGLFAVIAVMAALRERDTTGKGGLVQSGLFETNMVLVAQHMARAAIEGKDPPPYGDPEMAKPWPLYDVFDTADAQVFVGVVTETQWHGFCEAFGLTDLLNDPKLSTMVALAQGRTTFLPRIAKLFSSLSKVELMARCEALGLPFAPIARPADLFEDPHLLASGGLLPIELSGAESPPGGKSANDMAELPALPISLRNGRPGLRRQPPKVGEHGIEILTEAGLPEAEISGLVADGTLTVQQRAATEAAE